MVLYNHSKGHREQSQQGYRVENEVDKIQKSLEKESSKSLELEKSLIENEVDSVTKSNLKGLTKSL